MFCENESYERHKQPLHIHCNYYSLSKYFGHYMIYYGVLVKTPILMSQQHIEKMMYRS